MTPLRGTMSALGLAAPNGIRCQRAAVARPYGGSLRPRGLVVDSSYPCPICGRAFESAKHRSGHLGKGACVLPPTVCETCGVSFRSTPRRRFCTRSCYSARTLTDGAARFWSRVERGLSPSDCWRWTGTDSGYGHVYVKAAKLLAHRFSWELHFGPIPAGLCVLHRCDNPPCVNPAHLFLGTYADNTADMYAKGRHSRLRGADNPGAKLTWAQAEEIRFSVRARRGSRQSEITAAAQKYGVSCSTVRSCLRGERYVKSA